MGSTIEAIMVRRRSGGKEGDRKGWRKTGREKQLKAAAVKKENFLLIRKYGARATEWG